VKIWHLIISICYLVLIGAGHVVRSKITVGDISHVSFLIFCLWSNDKDNSVL
jgi:spore coat polysaccharide biosynthesis predicted glycosyltransferase SpsG